MKHLFFFVVVFFSHFLFAAESTSHRSKLVELMRSEESRSFLVYSAKAALKKSDLSNLSQYWTSVMPFRPMDMRLPQEEALLAFLKTLAEKKIDLCTAKILEIGFGSPALMATIQQIRKEHCAEIIPIVGIDPLLIDDWIAPFDQSLKIKLLKKSLADFSRETLEPMDFDMVIAVDVFKMKGCEWGPYQHSLSNAEALKKIGASTLVVTNDFDAPSALTQDLADCFDTSSQLRLINERTRDAGKVLGFGEKFGWLRVSIHSRKNCSN